MQGQFAHQRVKEKFFSHPRERLNDLIK